MKKQITFGTIFTQSFSAAFVVASIISFLADWLTSIPDNILYLVFFGSLALSMIMLMTVWFDKRHELEMKDQEAQRKLKAALEANKRPRQSC